MNEYRRLKVNLNTYNNILRKCIRIAQRNYYDKLFTKFKDDIKNTWKTINDILNKTKKKKTFPQYFKDNGNIITDKLEIANKFNAFFADIGPKLAQEIIMPENKHYKNYLTHKFSTKFHFQNVTEETVENIINKLKPKTSFGFDGISTKLVKTVKRSLINPITTIVNQMLNTGIFPDKLKIAKINPAYKKDDEMLFTNYRPISLLPALSKIFEKVIFIQLYDFFQKNKLFYASQFGFRQGHSTELAALEVVDRILVEMDKQDIPINIYLDLSKAFDTLDHNVLLYKLSYYGVCDKALKLMQSYLDNRQQYVEIDDIKSDTLTIQTGVPQGSILGPLLFIIYINDIANASTLLDMIIYADDTTLSGTLKFISQNTDYADINSAINNELDKINDWLRVNKLSLNVNKTKYMVFHTPQRKKLPELHLKLNGIEVEQVRQFNFLGIVLNEHLQWHDHTARISNKISRNIGIINRLKHFVPLNTRITLYNTMILSYIYYGILVWGHSSDRIKILQKRAIRIINLSSYRAHTEPLFKKLKLLKVEDIFKVQLLKFYYRYRHQALPVYLQNLPFYQIMDIHNYPTRANDEVRHPPIKHTYMKRCIRYSLSTIVNEMPNCIIDKIATHSIQGYAKYIKIYILDKYESECKKQVCYICGRN